MQGLSGDPHTQRVLTSTPSPKTLKFSFERFSYPGYDLRAYGSTIRATAVEIKHCPLQAILELRCDSLGG